MVPNRKFLIVPVVLLTLLVLFAPAPPLDAQEDEAALSIWRVYVEDQDDVDLLVEGGYDLVEGRGPGYLLVIGEDSVADQLRQEGLRVRRDRGLERRLGVEQEVAADGSITTLDSTFFGGYRTVDEHEAHLDAVAAAYPNLATLYDYGDSWLKVNGRPNGNDLTAICLTNKQPGDCALTPNSAKPRALIMAAIHARELQTSEVAWRLIDELTQNYATDPDIRHILDTTEVWIIPVANPDGREIVESGGNSPYLQRKNANDSDGNCRVPPSSSNHFGVDLNRNASVYNYGGVGTTSDPCAQTYRGTGPASEPEQASLEALFRSLWPDQKAGPNDPVGPGATGTLITMHSFGDLVLLPPGAGGVTPDDDGLRALAFRMSHYNGYRTGTGPEILYGVTGATDDWAYYELGVAAFTYELSPSSGSCSGFTPPYSCIDSLVWPANRDALLYAIKAADTPYATAQGPTTTSVAASPSVEQGEEVVVEAVIDDDAYGTTGVSRPSSVAVVEAEFYLDQAPSAGGSPSPMAPADGSFNEDEEATVATIDTDGLAVGEHTVFVRGRNTAGFWGPITATSFVVTEPVDDRPIAFDQAVATAVDEALAVTLTAEDPEGQTLSYSLVGGPSNGSLSGAAPDLVYTPEPGFSGADEFTFTASDGTNTSDPATISITVGVPVGPVFSDDFESDRGWVTDPAGTDTATTGIWDRANPEPTNSGGPKQLDQTTSGVNGLVTGAPAGASVGSDDVDGGITSIQSPPIALPVGARLELSFDWYFAHTSNSSADDFFRVTVRGDNNQVVIDERGAGSDRDAGWQRRTADLSGLAGQTVTVLVEAADAGSGSIVEAGLDSLEITSAVAGNRPPVADPQTITVQRDGAVDVTLSGSDPDGDQLEFAIVAGPSNGTITGSGANRTYQPDAGFSGQDSFVFSVDDGIDRDEATVSITVSDEAVVIFADGFEAGGGWVSNPAGSDTATTGSWGVAAPAPTTSGGVAMQLGAAAGSQALVTDGRGGTSAGQYDVDGGVTTVRSPDVALPASGQLTVSFQFYLAHRSNASSADLFRVSVVWPGGSRVLVDERGTGVDQAGAWASFSQDLTDLGGQTVYLLIEAADAGTPSLVEAGLDEVIITVQ